MGPERKRKEQYFRRNSLGDGRDERKEPARREHAGRYFCGNAGAQALRFCAGESDALDNGDHALDIEYGEVTVTRRGIPQRRK